MVFEQWLSISTYMAEILIWPNLLHSNLIGAQYRQNSIYNSTDNFLRIFRKLRSNGNYVQRKKLLKTVISTTYLKIIEIDETVHFSNNDRGNPKVDGKNRDDGEYTVPRIVGPKELIGCQAYVNAANSIT